MGGRKDESGEGSAKLAAQGGSGVAAPPGDAAARDVPAGPDTARKYGFDAPTRPPRIVFRRAAASDRRRGRARRRRRAIRRWAQRLTVAAIGVTVLGAGWLALRGWQANEHLTESTTLLARFQEQVRAGDTTAGRNTLLILREETGAARRATDDPVWWAAGHLPVVGDDLAAIASVASAVDGLAQDAAPALLDVAAVLEPESLAPKNGRVALEPLMRAAPKIGVADRAVRRARDKVSAIDPDELHPRLGSRIVVLRRQLDEAAATTDTAVRAAALLPPMLGTQGPRTYLVVFQNLAEVRATGGEFGAFAVVRADRGVVRVVAQGTAARDLGVFPKPVLPLGPAREGLYTDRLGRFPADVNFTPHFPEAATLVREMYRRRTGTTVDGVLATDPVALSYVLRGTGGVRLPSGDTLTAANAVRLLLVDSYARTGSAAEKDRFFAGAARATFDALVRGTGDPQVAFRGLVRASGERRLLVWNARPDEQRLLSGTVLEGSLPSADGPRPTVGVFLNDGTGAKLSVYLRPAAHLEAGRCRDDGRRELRLRVTLTSAAPRAGLPDYVLGLRLGGRPYTVRTNVLVFSPTGGGIVDARLDGRPARLGTGTERGRAVGVVTVDLPPGATKSLDVALITGVERPGADAGIPEVRTTPTVRPWTLTRQSLLSCR
ncbi:MAG TPA: DUF4012 domain-containing protein [Cryptosporangiaceae bacterium]|nr:DUF4012 domain-containing protein [Cryptosporangiaceae bacterium]